MQIKTSTINKTYTSFYFSLYGIGTRKIMRKELANTLSCTQSCIAKNHNRILNLIRKTLEY